MMIIVGVVSYFVLGYGTYRLTCLIHPPRTGHSGLADEEYTTWQGTCLPMVLGICLIIWPIVIVIEGTQFGYNFSDTYLQNQAEKALIKKSNPITKKTITSLPIVEPKDPYLEEGILEVEECLAETFE